MDKYVELLCKQNPEMTLKCGNPECSKEFRTKSKDVFQSKEFKHTCDSCGKSTTYDSTKFADNFKQQLKKLGITL